MEANAGEYIKKYLHLKKSPTNSPFPSCCMSQFHAKRVLVHNHSNGNKLRILMQIKLISLTIVERQDSLQNRGKQQLGYGLFCSVNKDLFGSKASGECIHLNLEGSLGLTSN